MHFGHFRFVDRFERVKAFLWDRAFTKFDYKAVEMFTKLWYNK